MTWSVTGTLRTSRCKLENLFGRQHRHDPVDLRGGRAAGDFEFFLEIRIVHEHLEHEAVLLRFGQRIGSFLLDRVLRGQHEERIGQRMPHAADRHLPLLHRFEQRGLRFRRRAVDFVGQDHVGEQRPFEKAEFAAAGRAVLLDDFGAGDVGRHQVGRELDAAERQAQAAGQRADHQRLGQARHAFQQAMAAAEERDQQLFDHLVLADDDLGQLFEDFFAGFAQLADGGGIVGQRFESERLSVMDGRVRG